ncbi:MAG: LysR family transcriptional regulator, partial [Rubrivivax sp.]
MRAARILGRGAVRSGCVAAIPLPSCRPRPHSSRIRRQMIPERNTCVRRCHAMRERHPTAIDGDPVAGSELAALVACVEAGSIHGAADRLNLTQSAVTKRLQRLEARLGVQLLVRSAHGVSLTPAGTLVHPRAEAALAALAGIPEAVAQHVGSAANLLELAASHTIGDALLSGWLLAFGRDHPQVRPTIEVINSPGVLEALRGGRAAIGFVEGDDPADDMNRLPVARDE